MIQASTILLTIVNDAVSKSLCNPVQYCRLKMVCPLCPCVGHFLGTNGFNISIKSTHIPSLNQMSMNKPYFCDLTQCRIMVALSSLKPLSEYMSYVYIKPYCRIQVYLVGFLLGYIMHRYAKTRQRIPGWVSNLPI